MEIATSKMLEMIKKKIVTKRNDKLLREIADTPLTQTLI